MSLARACTIAVALGAVLALPVQPAAAAKLSIHAAASKAAHFAERTCAHDETCTQHGVSNCRRERARLAFCRIFVRRNAEVQGRYRCSRLVRLGLIPHTRHAKVTGLGHWQC